MQMRPEGWEQQQLPGLRDDVNLLMLELGFATLLVEIVQVPDGDQLPCCKFVTATIYMPVVKLAGVGALDGVTHVLEGPGKERVALSEFGQRPVQRAKQFAIEILPMRLATHYQVGGALDRVVVLRGLTNTPGVLIVAAALETVDHLAADIKRERGGLFKNEATGCDFADGLVHGRMHAIGSVDSNPIRDCIAVSPTGIAQGRQNTQIG
jgi:hypothetical protein